LERQHEGGLNGLRVRISRKLDDLFKDREVYLRGEGGMRYLSLSRKHQMRWAVAALALGAWVVVSTAGLVGLGLGWSGARQDIAQQRLTYLDFLSEVGDYHAELSRVVEDFESNQSMLLSRLEQASGPASATGGLRSELERTETDKARVLLVRERVRTGLQDLESELNDIATRDAVLQERLDSATLNLRETQAEGSALAAARDRLDQALAESESQVSDLETEKAALRERLDSTTRNLQETQAEGSALAAARDRLDQALAESEGQVDGLETENAGLRRRVAELETNLAEAGKEFERKLAEAAVENETLVTDGAALRAEIASLYSEIAEAPRREAELQARIESLEDELQVAVASAESIENQREFYEIRTGSLETQLGQVSEVQKAVIQRLSERTLRGIDMIERIVAMTGLNINDLILGLKLAGPRDNQGGPFVPGDFLIGDDPYLQLQSSVALLDQQMMRWEALQHVVRVLPLASPLDQYRVTSGYGDRKDPVNGRHAMHDGIDLKAPTGSPVLATAPGTVSFAGWKGAFGRFVEIDHGNGIRTRYGHLSKILVKAGQEVTYREEIGLVGSSGRSTGPHVHYEVLVNDDTYDPSKFLLAGRNAFKE
jgi:murein DD-endopeptidase MepM/ murein hydrolase activator NlpD